MPGVARQKMQYLARLKMEVDDWRTLERRVTLLDELLQLSIEEKDDSLLGSSITELTEIKAQLSDMEFKLVLSGEYDERNAIIAFHAGAGGVESQDWVRMLIRMYLRWAEDRGFKGKILDISHGEEAGVKSAVVEVSGAYAYGYLKAERGVHRLVRISPFDADHARHTSFALVEALPEVEEGVDITVNQDDIKIDVFRAGGAGGQSVQKNSTAVRITHLPTGIKVSCQNERSQHQNKEIAMKILVSRLVELQTKIRSQEMEQLKGEHISPQWGNQIRSYVLHPYRMVKDHRTNEETSDADAVLNGNIDGFISSYLTSTVNDHKSLKK